MTFNFLIFDINQIKMHQTRMQRFFAQQFYIDTKSLRFIKLRTIQKLKIREWQKKFGRESRALRGGI